MSWDDLKTEAAKAKGSGGLYIKIADGESVEGVFRGDPYLFYSDFNSKKESEFAFGDAKFRFRINFLVYDKETDTFIPKILERGSLFAEQIFVAKDEYGLDCVYKITRKGSGLKTVHNLLFKKPLTKDQIDKISSTKLLDLHKKSNGNGSAQPKHLDDAPPHGDEDAPF